MDLNALKNEVATISCETSAIEFKSAPEPTVSLERTNSAFWVQLIRSVVAMHNSGGGVIVFGLDSEGNPNGGDLAAIRAVDPVQISDKVNHYTKRPLPDIYREEFEKNGNIYPGWIIPGAAIPLPFAVAGEVPIPGERRPKFHFYPGQVYVRRGAASVPADAGDMASISDRIRTAARKEFAEQIGRFAVIPEGHTIQVLPPGAVVTTTGGPGAMRITNDPTDPSAVVVDKFTTHPHRQTELLKRLATRIPGCRANGHDILCIRRVHAQEIEEMGFVWRPPHCAPQYPDEFVEWIAAKMKEDSAFFEKTRSAAKHASR